MEVCVGVSPFPRRGHSCVYRPLSTRGLVVFGGVCGYNTFVNDLYLLDLEHKRWECVKAEGALPPPLAWHSATVVQDNMFVIGGMLGPEDYSGDVYVLQLETFVWTKLALQNGTGSLMGSRDWAALFPYGCAVWRQLAGPRGRPTRHAI